MKNKILLINAINILLLGFGQASEKIWTNEEIIKIASSLCNDPEALSLFMKGSVKKVNSTNLTSEFKYAFDEKKDISDRINFLEKSVSLSFQDIVENNISNLENITEIDLSDFAQSEDNNINSIILNFMLQKFTKLKILILPSNHPSLFISNIFNNDTEKLINRYPALERIIGHHFGITNQELNIIFEHFKNYSYFCRDIPKTSGRYGCNAAFLSIESTGSNNLDREWIRGKKNIDKDNYNIFYSIDPNPIPGSFIMNASR